MATRRKRQRKIAPSVSTLIDKYAKRGYSASQIRLELKGASVPPALIPPPRTLQRAVNDITPTDDSGPWRVSAADGEDAALILPVLAAVIENTGGRRTHLTNREAAWALRLRSMAPDLEPLTVFTIAWQYLLRAQRDDPTDDLDAFLAFTPWRNIEHCERYFGAVIDGRISARPSMLAMALGPDAIIDETAGPQTRAFAQRVIDYAKTGTKRTVNTRDLRRRAKDD